MPQPEGRVITQAYLDEHECTLEDCQRSEEEAFYEWYNEYVDAMDDHEDQDEWTTQMAKWMVENNHEFGEDGCVYNKNIRMSTK